LFSAYPFVLEIKITSHGMLTGGGFYIISFFLCYTAFILHWKSSSFHGRGCSHRNSTAAFFIFLIVGTQGAAAPNP